MSDVSGGPGWWLASDGRWYPPEQQPGPPTIPQYPGLPPLGWVPPVSVPTGPPGTVPTALPPVVGGPAWGGVPSLATSPEPRRRARPGAIIIGVVLVLVVVNLAAVGAGLLVSGSDGPNAISYPTPVTKQGIEAANIGVQPGDLGSRFPSTSPSDPVTTHSVPGPCTPVSSSPWLAFQRSPDYWTSSSDLTVQADVVIMPTSRDALASLSAINAGPYGASCFLPSEVSNEDQNLASAGTRCGLSLQNATIAHLGPETLGGDLTGYRITADIVCSLTGNSTPFTEDIISQVVGPVFFQGTFTSYGPPSSTALEAQVMGDMAQRAGHAKS